MENNFVGDVLKQAIKVALMISSPMLIGALVMGILVSLFQAVTQIQEQTLTFVPKMVAVFLILAATFPWMAGMIIDMTTNLWLQIPIYSR